MNLSRADGGDPAGGPLNRRAEMWMKSREWLNHSARAHKPQSPNSACVFDYSGISANTHTEPPRGMFFWCSAHTQHIDTAEPGLDGE